MNLKTLTSFCHSNSRIAVLIYKDTIVFHHYSKADIKHYSYVEMKASENILVVICLYNGCKLTI